MLDSDEDHTLNIVPYPYMGFYQRACQKNFLTQAKSPDEKVNIGVMFKLIQLHFIVLMQMKLILTFSLKCIKVFIKFA